MDSSIYQLPNDVYISIALSDLSIYLLPYQIYQSIYCPFRSYNLSIVLIWYTMYASDGIKPSFTASVPIETFYGKD